MMRYFFYITLLFLSCKQPQCDINTTDFTPLPELTQGSFSGFSGGKYVQSNKIPAAHASQGINLARNIVPLNASGIADSVNGTIGMMVLGFSTAAMTGRFVREIHQLSSPNSKIEIIIGAQGGRDINQMTATTSTYWIAVDSAIQQTGLTPLQVQIIWLSSGDIEAYATPFPEQSLQQVDKYLLVMQNIKQRYPNCKIVFLSDRTFAGYVGLDGEGPKQLAEPTAYYNGWAIKWLIEKQISMEAGYTYTEIPFMDWGPYLWTNGTSPNKNGYTWDCTDAGKGGIHPSSKGRMKEASMMYSYFKAHPYLQRIFK